MRIFYDHQIFSRQYYGGISRYFCEVAAQLAGQADLQVTICAGAYVNQHARAMASGLVKGVPVPMPAKGLKMLERFNRQLFRGYSGWQRPDVVHETYYAPERLGPRSCPIVLTVYDMIHEVLPQYFPPRDPTASLKRRALHRADRIICISNHTRQDLLTLTDTDPDKVSVIHLGYSSPLGSDSLWPTPEPEAASPTSRPYLLYVGPRESYKNFAGLVAAYAQSSVGQEVDLVCFGGRPFSHHEYQHMAELGIESGRVHWQSGNDRRLASLYRQAVAYVCPSLYEGFGIPPLEAMACRCPVICSQTSSLPEVVGNAADYFDPRDRDSLIASLERVVFSPARQAELVAWGSQQVQRFSWPTCAQKTAEVYRSLQ